MYNITEMKGIRLQSGDLFYFDSDNVDYFGHRRYRIAIYLGTLDNHQHHHLLHHDLKMYNMVLLKDYHVWIYVDNKTKTMLFNTLFLKRNPVRIDDLSQ